MFSGTLQRMAKGRRLLTTGQTAALRAFKAAMADAELNVMDLSRASGVNYSTVAGFLSGDRWPQSGTLGKLEKAVNARLHELGTGASLPPGSVQAWSELGVPDRGGEVTTMDPLAALTDVELARELLDRLKRRAEDG